MANAPYKINHAVKKIELTKSFHTKASVIGSKEYNDVKMLHADFPLYEIVLKEIKKNSRKKTYSNLTYDNMRLYISEQGGKEELTMFDRILKMSQIQAAPYGFVKKWFLTNYSEYGKVESLISGGESSKNDVA